MRSFSPICHAYFHEQGCDPYVHDMDWNLLRDFLYPRHGLAAAGTLLMVFPLYGRFLTGLVLLIVDPPQRWPQRRVRALWIRLLSSGAAALLLTVTYSFYRSTDTHEISLGLAGKPALLRRRLGTLCRSGWGRVSYAWPQPRSR